MKNTIDDLRNHLFAQLEELRDPEAKVDLERAKLVNEIGRTLIDSAKAEVQFLNVTGQYQKASRFLSQEKPPLLTQTGGQRK